MSDESEIREAVNEAKAPGTFNIINVLQERAYPKLTVDIYMDEAAIFEMSRLKDRLEDLDKKVARKPETEKQKAERQDILTEIDSIAEKLDRSKYTVHLSGISEGKREELYRATLKKYPIEYVQSPMAGLLGTQDNRTVKESPERDNLFTDYLWQGYIEKIVNPDGEEQTEFAYATIRTMRESFPLNAIVRINEGIEKLRVATAMFTMETGEDFLAKP